MSDKEIKSAVTITFFEFADGRTGVDIAPNPDELPAGPAKDAAVAFENMLAAHGWDNTIRTVAPKHAAPLRLVTDEKGARDE